ncbi:homoserine dehydrogenase [bacterium]|nr:homoserine dehydrogenase [bacterium]
MNIGLIGFGVVGQGFYNIFTQKAPQGFAIKRIAAKNPGKARNGLDAALEFEALAITNDPEIDIIIEVTNDSVAAQKIIKTALQNKKHVVTANKQLLAKELPALLQLAHKNGVQLLFEAAAGGAIPVVQNTINYFQNEDFISFEAIINGSTNFILSQIFNKDWSYAKALAEAQQRGFAESDPTADVGGFDAQAKLGILISLLTKTYLPGENIAVSGVEQLGPNEVETARKHQLKIKQIAYCQKINNSLQAHVLPTFVHAESELYYIENELNAVVIHGAYGGKYSLSGAGAGGLPTGFAVYNDLLKTTEPHATQLLNTKPLTPAQTQLTLYLRCSDYEVNFERFGFETLAQVDFSSIIAKVSSHKFREFLQSPIAHSVFIAEATSLYKALKNEEKRKLKQTTKA